jgi:glycosyltransferase involved in cell wall biosynthesis
VKIHGICIVKSEADIISECLTAASSWCDHIYVLDNGSTDDTWQMVQALAHRLPAVVPWKSEQAPFSDGLRSAIFHHFRADSRHGDWWCRLDADEFYIDDPRIFLQKVPDKYDVVWTGNFSYYFTDEDAEQYRRTPERYGDDVPIEEKIRFYVNHWSEPRFFRFRDGITWAEGEGFPSFVYSSPAYPVRMWQKHFPYRSPTQIEQRLAARQEAISRGEFVHEALADWGKAVADVRVSRGVLDHTGPEFATGRWEDRVVPASSLDFDAHDRRLVVNEALMPALPSERSALRKVASRLRAGLERTIGRSS